MSEPAAEVVAADEVLDAAAEPASVAIYEIELEFPPGLVPLWRTLGQVSGARRRPREVRVVWHDTADGALAKDHLALADHGGTWRLTALRPGKLGWPPAGPAPVIAEALDLHGLGMTFEVIPIASFVGEQRTVEILTGEETVTARWITGHLRGVVDEIPVARVELRGGREALQRLALVLADQGASVPLASLAAQAIAVVEHAAPAPRHRGAAQVPEGTNVADGLAVAIGQLVDAALYWAARIPEASDAEPVHQMRVAVRRLRSLLGAPRKAATGPLWQGTKSMLGELARELGDARELDVFLEGVGTELARARPQDRRIGMLLARARKHREAAYAKLRADLASSKMRRVAVELALFAALKPFQSEGDGEFWATDCREFASAALDRRLRKLQAAGDDLTDLNAVDLHEVRKNAKRLRYTSELFAIFWAGGKRIRKYFERIAELQEALGAVNDAASLEHLLSRVGAGGFAAGVAVGIASANARPALKEAQSGWKKLGSAEKFWE